MPRGSCAGSGSPPRPNIVVLVADDMRWDEMGCAGNPVIQTPELDALAREGVLFKNNFCATAICSVSRTSLFTGQYAQRHGIHDFKTNLTPEALARTYPMVLRAAGYRAGFIGKWGVGADPPKEAFDYFDGFGGQGKYMVKVDGRDVHLTAAQTDSAIGFIESTPADRPFCLSLSFKAPHADDGNREHPFIYDPRHEALYADAIIPPPRAGDPSFYETLPSFVRESEGHTRWTGRFDTPERYQRNVKSIYRLISGIDEALGRIRATLRARGLEDSTVIVFTSDNGFYLGDRGLSDKWYMHEESIRTPLIVYDPRLPAQERGRRRKEMTLNVDLAPTVLELAGVAAPPEIQGLSLAPLARGKSSEWRKEWFYQHLFNFGGKIPRSEGVRTERWKYIRWLDPQPPLEQLFDLETDPLEARDLAKDPAQAEVLADMRTRWERLKAKAGELSSKPQRPYSHGDDWLFE